jgi:hypothetical protein
VHLSPDRKRLYLTPGRFDLAGSFQPILQWDQQTISS